MDEDGDEMFADPQSEFVGVPCNTPVGGSSRAGKRRQPVVSDSVFPDNHPDLEPTASVTILEFMVK